MGGIMDIKQRIFDMFVNYKVRQGAKKVVLQSMPVVGVWIDGDFYPKSYIVEQVKNKIGGQK
jgi:hypothetical protein